jgi:cytochrome c
MKSSLWFNMAAGAVLATGLGIMGMQLFSDNLYASDVEAVGYPVDAEEGSSASATKGPELLPNWGALFGDAAQLAAYQANGEKVTKVCQSCHDFSAAAANKTGPALAGVVGRAAGSFGGFGYSEPMKAFGQSWSYDQLNAFLQSPKKLVDGTSMSFAGLPKAEDRIAAIAYLRSISPSAPPIPAADPARDPAAAAAAGAAATPAAPEADGAATANAVAPAAALAPAKAATPAAAPAH